MLPLVDTLYAGDSLPPLTATYYDAAGNAQPGTASWSSSATGVVTVNAANGAGKGVAPGSAVITATINGVPGQSLALVTAPLSLSLLLDSIVLLPNDTFFIPVAVRKQGGGAPAPWFQSGNLAVFTVDSASGRTVSVSTGAASPFTVHADSLTTQGTVEVIDPGDTTTGKGGYTVLGSATARRRTTARAENFTRTGGTLTFRLALKVAVGNVTVEQISLTGLTAVVAAPDSIPLDSLTVSEAQSTTFLCQPNRNVALWSLSTSNQSILGVSRKGGYVLIRKIKAVPGGSVISGSFYFLAQRADYYNDPSGVLTVRGDFVAPLIQNTSTCH